MSEPRYYWLSETIRNWSIVAAAIFVFWWYGRDLKIAERNIAEVNARVSAATEPLQIQLAELEKAARSEKIARDRVEATLVEQQVLRNSSPSIRVKPILSGSGSQKGVREVVVDIQITNEGNVPVSLTRIQLIVSGGGLEPQARDIVNRTQRLWDLESVKDATEPLSPDSIPTPPSQAQLEYDRLHADCPHGRLFSLDKTSSHVIWTEIPELSVTRISNADIRVGGSVSELFAFVMTESLHHSTGWFRLALTVELRNYPPQEFTLFLPTGRQVSPGASYRVAKTVYEERDGTPPADLGAVIWSTQSPLAPTIVTSPSPE